VRNPIVNSLHNFCQFLSGNVNTINRSSPIIATIETRRIEALEIERGMEGAARNYAAGSGVLYPRYTIYIYISERPSRRFTQRRSE